jgi:hypothetical protein
MLLETQPTWVKVSSYIYLLCSLFVYTKLSQLKFKEINLVKQRDSIIIAAFFPVFAGLLLIFGSAIFLFLFSAPIISKLSNIIKRNRISMP